MAKGFKTVKPPFFYRVVRIAREEPLKRGSKARLVAYGLRSIAAIAGCDLKTVRRAIAAEQLDEESLESVLDWIEARKAKTAVPSERQPCETKFETTVFGETSALTALSSSRTP